MGIAFNHSQASDPLPPLPTAQKSSAALLNIPVDQNSFVTLDLSGEGPLSVKEVCRITGLSRTLISAQIRLGKLIARKAGRRTLVMRSDLRKWLEGLPTVQATARKGDV